MRAFQADVTLENCFSEIDCPVDVATLIFVLSAIHPDKFHKYVKYIDKSKIQSSNAARICINLESIFYLLGLPKICIMLLIAEEYYFFVIMGCMIWHNYVSSLDIRSVRISICGKMELGIIIFLSLIKLYFHNSFFNGVKFLTQFYCIIQLTCINRDVIFFLFQELLLFSKTSSRFI